MQVLPTILKGKLAWVKWASVQSLDAIRAEATPQSDTAEGQSQEAVKPTTSKKGKNLRLSRSNHCQEFMYNGTPGVTATNS